MDPCRAAKANGRCDYINTIVLLDEADEYVKYGIRKTPHLSLLPDEDPADCTFFRQLCQSRILEIQRENSSHDATTN